MKHGMISGLHNQWTGSAPRRSRRVLEDQLCNTRDKPKGYLYNQQPAAKGASRIVYSEHNQDFISSAENNMERWAGRVAVITGASAGIGTATAEELVKKGLKVVGLARRAERIEELAEFLKSAPGKLYALKCDITKEAEVQEAFKWIKTNLGGVDILINNAGVASNSKLIGGPVENWRAILELNVLALSVCTKEALQSMKERGVDDGHIIHINSIVGHTIPQSDLVVHMYCASKHAVTALTEGLRRELVKQNSKIRVTSVSPGLVATEFLAASGRPVDPKQVYGSNPHLLAKDVADAILYALGVPPHVQIHELTIKPTGEKL